MSIKDLKHVVRPLPNGGQVVLLNTGAEITAEDLAMLQALYSRSPKGIYEHLQKLDEVGSGKFMDTFYVGYGHKSIGDCGDTVFFIEGVSMLVAKAVQDWMLYNGQECSTRYLDFSKQPFIDPLNSTESRSLLEYMRAIYSRYLPLVKEFVAACFPRQDGEDEKQYDKAVSARAFDVTRSLLPAGAATSLSWMSNLRQVTDKLLELRHHPLPEVKAVAEAIESAMIEAYPHSVPKRYDQTESYYREWMSLGYLLNPDSWPNDVVMSRDGIDQSQLREFSGWLYTRPNKVELPKKVARAGMAQFRFCLDFGSYRDIQRQRAVIQQMPLLSTRFGFEQWYLDQLPSSWLENLQGHLSFIEKFVRENRFEGVPDTLLQYYIPMGYRVPCEVTGDLPALVYLVELRSGSMVHPTLRIKAQAMAKLLEAQYGNCGLRLHVDYSEVGRFDIKRGKQDIVERVG